MAVATPQQEHSEALLGHPHIASTNSSVRLSIMHFS